MATLRAAVRTGVQAGQVDEAVGAYRELYARGEEGAADRRAAYGRLVDTYYDLVTDFYEFGWGHSFHFGVRRRGETFEMSLRRHEYWLALQLGLRPGQEVLDVGCGVGGPMRNIAHFSGADVVGINRNDYQVERGRTHNARAGLADRCTFVKGDFMAMPFEGARFDAAYAIEATCHAPDRAGVFGEVHRVLKPGARFAGYEWCLTDRYDPSDAEHRRLARGIEEGDALPELRHTSAIDAALRDAGFELVEARDLAPECDPETPWYLPLSGRDRSLRGLPRTAWGRAITHRAVGWMERAGLAPKGATEVHAVLDLAADALVRAGELGIFTPMYHFLARKT